jgi:hypothetical protein
MGRVMVPTLYLWPEGSSLTEDEDKKHSRVQGRSQYFKRGQKEKIRDKRDKIDPKGGWGLREGKKAYMVH